MLTEARHVAIKGRLIGILIHIHGIVDRPTDNSTEAEGRKGYHSLANTLYYWLNVVSAYVGPD